MGNRATTRGPSAWGGGDQGGGGGDAPADAGYVVTAANGVLTNETLIGSIILTPNTFANRPSAVGLVAGTIYYSTDNGYVYRADGAGTWVTAQDLLFTSETITGDVTTTGVVELLPTSSATDGESSLASRSQFTEVAPARTATGQVLFATRANVNLSSASVAVSAQDGANAGASLAVVNTAGGEFASVTVGGAILENDNNELMVRASGDVGTGKYTANGTEGLLLYSPDGTEWRVTISNAGVLATAVV